MAPRKDTAASATFGDHEVITPENKLRNAVSMQSPVSGEDDPVARAEQALSSLSHEFESWMDSECNRLDQARRSIGKNGFTTTNKEALFHAAHDIKGEAATCGYPAVAAAADTVRAIYREYARSDAKELAARLTKRLREVTDEFLIYENRDRPDVLEQIAGPSIAPE
jgi:HPt (histidine-containing phosphotransfer) domain-containing protein